MSARHGAGGGFSSEVSFAICTSLPNFSSLRSGSQVDAPWMRGSRRGAERAPAEPEPQRLRGWTPASQVQVGCQAPGWGRQGAAGGGLAPGSGAPPRSGRAARAAAGLGVGSPGRRRLRAASLPAALPARRRRRRPRQTMNLRARRVEAGLSPASLGPASPRPSAVSSGGGPSPRVPTTSGRPVRGGPRRKGCPEAAPGLECPLSGSRECSRSAGTGDREKGWWRCGQPDAGGGRTPRGTRGPAAQRNSPRSRNLGVPTPPRSGSCRRRTDGQTTPVLSQCERALGGGRGGSGIPPARCLAPPRTSGKFPSPGQVSGYPLLSPRVRLGASCRPPVPVPRPHWVAEPGWGRRGQAPTPVGPGSGRGHLGGGRGRRRGRGRAQSGLNFCSPTPPPSSRPSAPAPAQLRAVAREAAGLGSCRRFSAVASPAGWARRAERGRSERRCAAAAAGSRGGSGPGAGATLAIVLERKGVGVCVCGRRGRVAQLTLLESPGMAGWRHPGEGNLAFG